MSVAARTRYRHSFGERLQFIRGLIAYPRHVASLFPSSRALARRIAAQVDPAASGIVLELGPGTGAVTAALIERGIDTDHLLLVEAAPRFADFLRMRFPSVEISCSNALDFEQVLRGQPLAAIVSGLPLLNFDECKRVAFVDRCLSLLGPTGPLVQLSFGWSPPVAPSSNWQIESAGVELLNIPPATVWVYSRNHGPISTGAVLQCASQPPRCKICGAPSVESGEGHDDANEPLCLHHLEALDPPAVETPKKNRTA